MLAKWHWHIEISSRCTLKCARCARQEVPETLVNTELKLNFFKKNFPKNFVEQNIKKITFCGDDGDPIYSTDLIKTIEYFKNIKPDISIVIITNGSYKKQSWWENLALKLNSYDTVHFSIDGWNQDSNDLYRTNNNFQSIITGIQTLRKNSNAYLVWASIAFKFNENKIDTMIQKARDLQMDQFQLTKSTKFGSVYEHYGKKDELEPSGRYVSSTARFEREVLKLTNRQESTHRETCKQNFNNIIQSDYKDIIPLCAVGNKGIFINSKGELFPCCWTANRYEHNSDWAAIAKKFNLHDNLLEDVLNDKFWSSDFQSFKWQECKTKCNKKIVNLEYAQEW